MRIDRPAYGIRCSAPRPAAALLAALTLAWMCADAAAFQQRADRHIRVVLDTSISMRSNDPLRLAPLSTLLLHDLARVNTTLGDTFAVIPFHPNWQWASADQAAPTSVGAVITAGTDRSRLQAALRRQAYDAKMTYYYPGLLKAVEELERFDDPDDIRVAVIVTDGLPEEPTREAELNLIRTQLGPRMAQAGIQLYVLAFGPALSPGFFAPLIPSSGGQILHDGDGRQLPWHMAQIFSKSFGYQATTPQAYSSASQLDLAQGQQPAQVATLLFRNDPAPPGLKLQPPAGGQVITRPDLNTSGSEAKSSFSLQWTLTPDSGAYRLQSDARDSQVVVLRPAALTMSARPLQAQDDIGQTMAEVLMPMGILLRPPAGSQGDPGEVQLTFRSNGRRLSAPDPKDPGRRYEYQNDPQSPPAGERGEVIPEGRLYRIFPQFRQPDENEEFYVGYVEVEARRGGVLVARLVHPVEVYPRVAVSPTPQQRDAKSAGDKGVLERGEQGCAVFQFEVREGWLPHPRQPSYTLRAFLQAPLQDAFFKANVFFNGLPLEVEGKPGDRPGRWYAGRSLSREELLGEHRICVQIGRPTNYDTRLAYGVQVGFLLGESPYQQFKSQVFEPFTLMARIAPPNAVQSIAQWLLPLLMLLMLALWWYSRFRPRLPEDLMVALGAPQSPQAIARQPLGHPTLASRLLGLIRERPVSTGGNGPTLGWLRPDGDQLYGFRPAAGVQVRSAAGAKLQHHGSLALISVARDYRITTKDREFLFRLEYK